MSLLPKWIRFFLSLRYKVEVEGEEIIKKYKDRSILFLANHPATIDPVIVLSFLEPYIDIQPLAAEKFFKAGFTRFFLEKIHALRVPEFETGNNEYKAYKVEKLTEALKKALSHKAHILLYPSGHLSDLPKERIGGAALAFELKDVPKKLLGIAVDGLYGSIFSRYFEKKTPSFTQMLFEGAKIVLKNGIFFVPKRKVTLRVFEFDAKIRQIQEKLEFNEAVEQGLNSHLSLKTVIVPYGRVPTPTLKVSKNHNHIALPDEMKKELTALAEKVTKRKITIDEHLSYDAGVDSLELAEIMTFVEQKYHKRIDQVPSNLHELGVWIMADIEKEIPKPEHPFTARKESFKPKLESSRNLVDAFIAKVQTHPFQMAAFDASLGSISYAKALMLARIMSKQIARLEGRYIGIMLPASTLSYILVLATLMAHKTPTLLNWTGGRKSIDQAVDTVDLKVILSSGKFLEKAFNVDLGPHFEKVVLLESIKEQIGLKEKLKALFETLFSSKWLSEYNRHTSQDDPAVCLFTSGSEAMPKGVPLSHRNILFNIEASLATELIDPKDRFLATLPPFHSFGCVVSGLLPLLCGVEVVYAPDPTDVIGILHDIKKYQCTLFCTAPSFLKQILMNAEPGDLDSLRMVVVGAEKCPDNLKALFKEKCIHAFLLEGYGITECSPIVTIQRSPTAQGVGTPLKGIELLIVDPESLTPLPQGEEGEILIHAPSVFKGYIGIKKDPFVEVLEKTWYRTGDRGALSPRHELLLKGRYKRFIKISAEMISLGALEEALELYRPSKDGVPRVAVLGNGAIDKIVLVTTYKDLDLEDIHHFFRTQGLPKVAKIHDMHIVESIPQLASGKIDYRTLEHAHF